jgi:polysaccharide chain length determinant protein (PEP-CTERM system associated)
VLVLPGKQYTPLDFLRIARRRKALIILPFLIVTIASATAAKLLPNRYRSETLILVVPQRVPESYVRSTVTTRIEDRLESISQQILSHPRLQHLILDFNLYAKQRRQSAMDQVVERMRDDIEVQLVKGEAFRVSYVADDARTAMQVTERLASLFIEENLRDREVLAEGTNQFLKSELADARQRLIEHEKKLEAYRGKYAGQLPSQVDSNLEVVRNAEMQLQTLTESFNRDRDRRLSVIRALGEANATAAAGASRPGDESAEPKAVSPIAQELDTATRTLTALQTRLKPEHPDIVAAKLLIRDLQRKFDAEAAARAASPKVQAPLVSPADATLRAHVQELRTELSNLDSDIAFKEQEQQQLRSVIQDYQSRVDAAPARESDLLELTRDYDTLQKAYVSLLEKREESMISANLERRRIGEQFKIVEPARQPDRPFKPNRPLLVLLGALGGLALGVALAGLLEFLDTTLRSDADVVHALALPALAIVPVIKPAGAKRDWFPFSTTSAPSILSNRSPGEATASEDRSSLAELHSPTLKRSERFVLAPERFKGFAPQQARRLVVFPGAPVDAIEQYRKLAAVLHHAQQHRQLRIVMIASAFPHEGKTLTAVNVALTLSESYRRTVLLVDADLRRPTIQDIVQANGGHWLRQMLLAPAYRPLEILKVSPSLAVLPAGGAASDPMSLLVSERMAQMIAAARDSFDWTVIDTPPVGVLTDAKLLASMVDGVVLVVQAGKTPHEAARQVVQTLSRDRIVGVVLNRAEPWAVTYHSYYGDYSRPN